MPWKTHGENATSRISAHTAGCVRRVRISFSRLQGSSRWTKVLSDTLVRLHSINRSNSIENNRHRSAVVVCLDTTIIIIINKQSLLEVSGLTCNNTLHSTRSSIGLFKAVMSAGSN